jgi:hypothetical protein
MGKVWVLDTSTKGTGAEMVPLEKVLREADAPPSRRQLPPRPKPRTRHEPEPRPPARFKVVDVVTDEVLAEGIGPRATLEALGRARSVVDVRVYLLEEPGRWRRLTHGERKLLWERRRRAARASAGEAAASRPDRAPRGGGPP